MKTQDGKDITEYQAAKKLIQDFGDSVFALGDKEITDALDVKKMTTNQSIKLQKHLKEISKRVGKYLGLAKE